MSVQGVPRDLVGPVEKVQADIVALRRTGELLYMAPPQRYGNGWHVRVLVRPTISSTSARPRLAPTARPAWTPRDLTPGQRKAITVGSALLGAGAVVAGLVWLIVRAVSSAASWVGANPTLPILVVLVAVIGGWKWITRERSPSSKGGSGGGCPGIACHCQGCRGH